MVIRSFQFSPAVLNIPNVSKVETAVCAETVERWSIVYKKWRWSKVYKYMACILNLNYREGEGSLNHTSHINLHALRHANKSERMRHPHSPKSCSEMHTCNFGPSIKMQIYTLHLCPLSEHLWEADCAIFLTHQHCLNSTQSVPEGL